MGKSGKLPKSVGDLKRRVSWDSKQVARMVRDLADQAGHQNFLLNETVNGALAEYPVPQFMTLRRAVRAGLREAGIRVGTLEQFQWLRQKISGPASAVVKKNKKPTPTVNATLPRALLDRVMESVQKDRRGRLVVLGAVVKAVLHPNAGDWRLRRALHSALAARGVDRCTASEFEGRTGRKVLKKNRVVPPPPLEDEDEPQVAESDHQIVREGGVELRAGLREDELLSLEAQLAEDPSPRPGSARVRRHAPRVRLMNRPSLVVRVDVRLAAAKWLQEQADGQENREVLSPLSRLVLHLVFRELVPYLPSTSEIREILAVFARAGIVSKYDEERAVVRVLEFSSVAQPRRKRAVRGG